MSPIQTTAEIVVSIRIKREPLQQLRCVKCGKLLGELDRPISSGSIKCPRCKEMNNF